MSTRSSCSFARRSREPTRELESGYEFLVDNVMRFIRRSELTPTQKEELSDKPVKQALNV
jgi:hypothetical protein